MEACAVLAGAAAARTLRAGGNGRLEVALGSGGYVRIGDDGWVLVAGPRAVVGPLSLLVAGLGATAAEPGWPARAGDGMLVLGPHRIALEGVRVALPSPQPRERRGDVDEARAPACRVGQERSPRRDDDDALAAACAGCLEPPPGLRDGIDALERGAVARGVDLLAGRGDGLTPAGDDVLAGYAAWEWPAGGASGLARLAAGRASPIGLAYLRCAERGELPEPAAATLAAIRAGDVAAAARHGRTLSRWGSSSGAALLWGMAAGRRAEFSAKASCPTGLADR